MTTERSTIVLYVLGMHCHACEISITDIASGLAEVERATVDRQRGTLTLSGAFTRTTEDLASELEPLLKEHGYRVFTAPPQASEPYVWRELFIALPLAISIIIALWLLRSIDIASFVRADSISYGTAFLIGVVASLSTCIVVVGGFVLSLSATFAQHAGTARPMLLFHGARLGAFFLLGGALGYLGSSISISYIVTSTIGIAVGMMMLILGIHLTGLAPRLRVPTFSGAVLTYMRRLSGMRAAPIVAGALTFFLPCGFTQAMQFYTLSAQGFLEGGLIMGSFALGTLPVLAALSFGSYRVRTHPWSGVFFKTAGILIVAFSCYTISLYLPL